MFEGFILDLGAVEPAYSRDLSLENGLSLSHPRVISLFLGFLLGALGLRPGEFGLRLSPQSFVPGPLRNVFGSLRLNQFLL